MHSNSGLCLISYPDLTLSVAEMSPSRGRSGFEIRLSHKVVVWSKRVGKGKEKG